MVVGRSLLVLLSAVLSVPLLARSAREIPLHQWKVAAPQLRISTMSAISGRASFVALDPCRVVDTRNPNGPYGGPKLVGGTSRSFIIPGGPCAGIPVGAAYSLNLTVTQPEADNGFLKAYPSGTPQPLVASLNFNMNETKGNAAIVPADGTGSIDIYTNVNTHLIIDINGYFKEGVVTNLTAGTGMIGGGTGSVTLGIANGGVGTTQLANAAVTSAQIANGAVGTAQIANLAVGAAQLADASVTSAKIAANAVGTREISVPSGQAWTSSPVLIASSANYIYPTSTTVTLAEAGVCMASAQAQIDATGARDQNTFFRVAIERAGANDDDGNLGFYFLAQSAGGKSIVQTRTAAVPMNAGQATRFGCRIFTSSDRAGDIPYCFVSWICF